MPSVDNRVVKMDFQNAQFQKGVTETLGSLENLTRQIKDTTGTRLDSLSSGVDNVSSKFSLLSIAAGTGLAKLTSGAIDAGVNMARGLWDPIVEGGKNRALSIEQAKFQFRGLGVDVEKAMESSKAAVKGTAYGLDEAARMAGIFATSGVEAGDDMTTSLRAVAGTAAMSGSSFMEVGDIFADVYGKGRAQAEDFNRLGARGINGLQVLAEHLGTTQEEVRTMASKGKIDADTFAKAMSNAYGDHATKANETYTGSLSNMRAAMSRLGAAFQEPKLNKQRDLFNALSPVFDALGTALEPVVDLYTRWSKWSGDRMVSTITSMVKPVENLKTTFGNISRVVENFGKTATSIFKPIGEAFSNVFSLSGAGMSFTNFLGLVTGKIADFTEKLVLSESAQTKLRTGFEGLFNILRIGYDIIKNVATAVSEFASGLLSALSPSGSLLDFFSDIGEKTTSALSGVSNLTNGLKDLGRATGEKVARGLNSIGDVLKKIGSWISENISVGDVLNAIIGVSSIRALSSFKGVLDNIKDFIGDPMKSLFGTTADGLKSGGESIKDSLGLVADGMSSFTGAVKISQLVMVAGSILMLSSALKTLSKIDGKSLLKSMSAVSAMFVMLSLSLKSFSKTLNVFGGKGLVGAAASLLLISWAIKSLAGTMQKIGDLNIQQIAKGLLGLMGLLAEIAIFLKMASGKSLSLKSAAGVYIIAQALKSIATALEDIGNLSVGQIRRGLSGMGGALAEIALMNTVLGKVAGLKSIFAAGSILITAQSLADIAKSLQLFSDMTWDQIVHGLAGMGGALTEISLMTTILGKVAGLKSIFAAGSILLVTESLADIAESLKTFGSMTWDEITRGLSGMGGALAEIVALNLGLKYVGGMKSLFTSGSVWIVTQGLLDIAKSMVTFAGLSWDGIQKGLSGLAGALTAMVIPLGILGKIAPFGSVLAGGAILTITTGLVDIAESFLLFANMSWDQILRGLSGMGGALVELSVVVGVLGSVAPISGFLGGGAILLGVQGLGDLAQALVVFGSMSWSEIGRGLTAMGGALVELGVVVGLLGSLAPLSVLGSGAILLGVEGLFDLALALEKFGMMSWDEIGRGLTAMAGALGELALGSLVNTLGWVGAQTIKDAAKPLGDLADSVQKWTSVSVPKEFGDRMREVASGIRAFSFSWLGGKGLDAAAKPLGDLADSVVKWGTVVVPKDINKNLQSLADGISAFNLGDWFSGKGLGSVTGPLKDMATAVNAWTGVTVPKNIGKELSSLAEGISAFTIGDWFSGLSIGNAVGPLKDMADSVKAWSGVTVPKELGGNLKELASGIGEFTAGDWFSGLAIGNSVEPLADLASSVTKWNGVVVPKGMKENLTALADGIKSFSWTWFGSNNIDDAVEPLKHLADAVKKWNGVTVPPGMHEKLKSLADGIKEFRWSGGASDMVKDSIEPLKLLADAVKKWDGVSISTSLTSGINRLTESSKSLSAAYSLSSMASSINKVGDMADAVKKWGSVNITPYLGGSLIGLAKGLSALSNVSGLLIIPVAMDSIAKSIVNLGLKSAVSTYSIGSLSSVFNTLSQASRNLNSAIIIMSSVVGTSFSRMSMVIRAFASSFGNTMSVMVRSTQTGMVGIRTAISSAVPSITSAARAIGVGVIFAIVSGMASRAGSVGAQALSVGYAISNGMARGIYAGSGSVYVAAQSVALRALASAKSALGVHSPSREFAKIGKFSDEGLAQGLRDNAGIVSNAGTEVGKAALNSVVGIVKQISDALDENIDYQPTIRPVLDLTGVQDNVAVLDSIPSTYAGYLDVSTNLAASANLGYENNREVVEGVVTTGNNTTIEYNQYNNSPKSLSNVEIYRQTRNQLSTLKGRVNIDA